MQTAPDSQNPAHSHPDWIFLADYFISEFRFDANLGDELTAGLLFRVIRDLEISPGNLAEIDRILTAFTREAMERCAQGKLQLPVQVRLFCQRQAWEDRQPGGWGYFLIEKGSGDPDLPDCAPNSIELYLYEEGIKRATSW